jgi:hypothetical protein
MTIAQQAAQDLAQALARLRLAERAAEVATGHLGALLTQLTN